MTQPEFKSVSLTSCSEHFATQVLFICSLFHCLVMHSANICPLPIIYQGLCQVFEIEGNKILPLASGSRTQRRGRHTEIKEIHKKIPKGWFQKYYASEPTDDSNLIPSTNTSSPPSTHTLSLLFSVLIENSSELFFLFANSGILRLGKTKWLANDHVHQQQRLYCGGALLPIPSIVYGHALLITTNMTCYTGLTDVLQTQSCVNTVGDLAI